MTKVREEYEDGVCPDCGEEIPLGAEFGDECDNCGHVFNEARADDDLYDEKDSD